MKQLATVVRIVLWMALVAATTAPASAAPIFGAADSLQVSACGDLYPTPSGSLGATPVNGGAGVILSGSASVTGTSDGLCMQLEWGGSMSGSIDSVADVPLAWDFSVSVSDQAEPFVSTDVYFEVSHQPYMVGGFNQGGYAYSTSVIGTGQFTSPADLSLNWPGPPPSMPRSFTSYYVRMLVFYVNFNTTPTTETLSIDIPSATSLDLGDVRRGAVPEPATCGLIAAGLVGVAWRKRAAAR